MHTRKGIAGIILVLTAGSILAGGARAAEWHVAPEGRPENNGTQQSPWDLRSALTGRQDRIRPGDTVFLKEGTYMVERSEGGTRASYDIRLVGTAEQPIHIRPAPGARATIDGGLRIVAPSQHLWLWELELTTTGPRPRDPVLPADLADALRASMEDPDREACKVQGGGLNILSGDGHKAVNLVVHDNYSGIDSWRPAHNTEVYGCLIYNNGWIGPSRGHGHGSYTQNEHGTGTKLYSNNIYMRGYGCSMHAYGSGRAWVDDYVIENNIVYDFTYARSGEFLIGGGRPSRNIRVIGNILHHHNMRVGYDAPHNENAAIRDNVIVGGNLNIVRYRQAEESNNLVMPRGRVEPRLITRVFPNQYDPTRANIVIIDAGNSNAGLRRVQIDASAVLDEGAAYRLMDPQNFFGEPIHQGTADSAGRITVPMQGEIAVFVLLAGESCGNIRFKAPS
jgi:hypothetical protein